MAKQSFVSLINNNKIMRLLKVSSSLNQIFRLVLKVTNLDKNSGFISTWVNSCKMNLDMSEPIQRSMYKGLYEPIQTNWFKQILKMGDCVVDLGANFGYYTTLSSKLIGNEGIVFAFEPSLRACSSLYQTIQSNNLVNVELYCYAVGDMNGLVELQVPPANFESHSPSILTQPYQNKYWKSTLVPLVSLDSFFKKNIKLKKIKLIKIDVEGFEPNVLRGLKDLASKGMIENIICEFNSGWLEKNNSSHDELLELFLSLGFVVKDKTSLLSFYEKKIDKVCTLQDFYFQYKSLS